MPIGLGKNRSAIAEINITPLVDVMLVILIIFMVVAPTIQHGVKVDVPEATFTPIESQEVQVVVTVTKKGDIYINNFKTAGVKNLQAKLAALYEKNPERELFLKADKNVPYGTVIKAMAAIKSAGIDKIGMITEPEE
ncbi:protein TolR [Thermodesulfobacteriota bacterium]